MLVENRTIDDHTLVFADGMENWTPFQELQARIRLVVNLRVDEKLLHRCSTLTFEHSYKYIWTQQHYGFCRADLPGRFLLIVRIAFPLTPWCHTNETNELALALNNGRHDLSRQLTGTGALFARALNIGTGPTTGSRSMLRRATSVALEVRGRCRHAFHLTRFVLHRDFL